MGLYETSLLAGYQWIQRRAERTFPSKLVSLTPEPSEVPHSSLAHMFGTWARGMEQVSFVGSIDEAGRWQVDVGRFIEAVQGEDVPALVVGTAFGFVHLLDGLDAEGLSVGLPEGSMILETGGYKGQSREIPKADLHRWIVESLGIHDRDIVNEYGMSELSSQAYSINGDPLVVPSWMRVELVSAETGRPIEDGGRGLIRVVDLANVRSVCSILTEDLGERRGDGFELHGRKLDAEPKGCSLLAV